MAATIGRDFSVELLEHAHEIKGRVLHGAIRRLVNAGLVLPSGPPGSGRFRFKHSLIQDTAYGMMVRGRRRMLHARVAQTLELHFPHLAAADPHLMARHCTEAGLIDKAVGWWLRAGTQSLLRAAASEALAQLRRGLELCATLPESTARHRQELDLQILLGKAINATEGHAVPGARAAFDRARMLSAELEGTPQLLTVLFGQWATKAMLHAELAAARRLADELLAEAYRRRDPVWELTGCFAAGFTYFALGAFSTSHRYLRRGLEVFEPERRETYASPMVGDPRVMLNTYLCWERLYTGHLAETRAVCDAAVTEARALGHSYSLAHALSKQAGMEIYIGTPAAALVAVEELQALADDHGIAFFRAAARGWRAWCVGMVGDPREGLSLFRQSMALYRDTGTRLHLPTFMRREAELLGRVGDVAGGLARIEETWPLLAATGERFEEAEIHRTKGELLAQRGDMAGGDMAAGDMAAAEASLVAACGVAASQGALLLELRARKSLAEMLSGHGRRGDAAAALAPVTDRFEPDCEAPDVVAARRLLEEVS